MRGKNRALYPLVSSLNLLTRAFAFPIRYRLYHDMRKLISNSTPAAAHCVKRRKTTSEYSVPRSTSCSLRAIVSEGPVPDLSTSRTTARRRYASVGPFSEYISADPVGARVSQRARSDTGDQNTVSGSTDLASGNDQEIPPPVQAQMVQAINLAVPVTEEVSESFTRASATGIQMKVVQALERERRDSNTPLVSTPDNPSVMAVFSLPPVSLRPNAAASSSTAFDGHGKHSSEYLENSAYFSPANGNPKIALTAGVRSSIVAPSSPGLGDDSHGAGSIEENPAPRTPAGFNRPAHQDASNITSPGGTASRQFRHGSRGSYVHPTVARPSSSHTLVSKEPKTRRTVNSDRRSGKASSSGGRNKQVKDKPKLITPLEYAQKLQSSLDLRVTFKTNYLKGKRIFYVGGDMMYASPITRGRMEYVSTLFLTHPPRCLCCSPYTACLQCGTI